MKQKDLNFKGRDKETLKKYVKVLIENGYKVYIPVTKDYSWVHVLNKKNQIAYIQIGYFFGIDFASVCKPTIETGKGSQRFEQIENPKLKHIEETFDRFKGTKGITYKDFEEFQKDSWCKHERVVLE